MASFIYKAAVQMIQRECEKDNPDIEDIKYLCKVAFELEEKYKEEKEKENEN